MLCYCVLLRLNKQHLVKTRYYRFTNKMNIDGNIYSITSQDYILIRKAMCLESKIHCLGF